MTRHLSLELMGSLGLGVSPQQLLLSLWLLCSCRGLPFPHGNLTSRNFFLPMDLGGANTSLLPHSSRCFLLQSWPTVLLTNWAWHHRINISTPLPNRAKQNCSTVSLCLALLNNLTSFSHQDSQPCPAGPASLHLPGGGLCYNPKFY